MTYLLESYRIELDGNAVAVPVGAYAYAAVQVVPIDYGSTSGVLEVKASLSGDPADMVSFASAVTPNMTSKAISDDIDVREVEYLHIDCTTSDSGKHAAVWVYATSGNASDADSDKGDAGGEIELDGRSVKVGVARYTRAALQISPKYATTSGVLELKRSLSGDPADMVSFATAVTPNMTSRAISSGINIRDTAYVHLDNTTADSGKYAAWFMSLGQTDRASSDIGVIPIWAEENSTLGIGATYEWAYGNGANSPSGSGVYIPWDYEIVAMGLYVNNASGVATVQAERNGSAFATAAQVSCATSSTGSATFAVGSRPQGSAGDFFNFKTVSSSATGTPCHVVAWIRPTT